MSKPCIQHIESVWKEKTGSANHLFNKGKFKEALIGYEAALIDAEMLNDCRYEAARKGIPFMQIYAISCNNIAFTHEEMGEVESCKNMLERVLHYFLFLYREGRADDTVLQNELKTAFFAYKDFSGRYGLELQGQLKVFGAIREHFLSSFTI